MTNSQVIILGGGVSGIACARALQAANIDYLLLEGSGKLGGRLKSDKDQGYIFDHGFQVFLSSYTTTKGLIGDTLKFSSFAAGATVNILGRSYRIADPIRQPDALLDTIKAPIGSSWDKLLMVVLKLISAQRAREARHDSLNFMDSLSRLIGRTKSKFRDPSDETSMTAAEYLLDFGFSQRMIDQFFRPFLGGIFLDASLSTSADIFLQVFGNFSRGYAQLPDGGMGELAKSLAAPLDSKRILLNQKVVNFTVDRVALESGEILQAKKVISALDADSLRSIKPYLSIPTSNSVSCFYFSSDAIPEMGNYLILNGSVIYPGNNNKGPNETLINNIAPLSNVNRSYAPPGKLNLSVSVLGEYSDEVSVELELKKLFPHKRFEFLRKYTIKGALPSQSPFNPHNSSLGTNNSELIICGDFRHAEHNDNLHHPQELQRPLAASIETAVRSGLNAAKMVTNRLM